MRQFHEDIFKYSLLKTDTYIFVDNSVDNFLFVKKWLIFQYLSLDPHVKHKDDRFTTRQE